MSQHWEEFDLHLSLERSAEACRVSFSNTYWTIKKDDETYMLCKEREPVLLEVIDKVMFFEPSLKPHVEIFLSPVTSSTTRVTVKSNAPGWRQQEAAKKRALLFRSRIEKAAMGTPEVPTTRSSKFVKGIANTVSDAAIRKFRGSDDTDGTRQRTDLSSELERLAELREKGVLTEEEFRKAKARLIDG